MIKINANDIRREAIDGFVIVCQQCGSNDVTIKVEGAEYGDIGEIEITCNGCGWWDYSYNIAL